jgi:hypothetical protein
MLPRTRLVVPVTERDQTFSFELLRAIGYTAYDGADIGECLATAARIKEGDVESWHTEWTRTAQRVQKIAEDCTEEGTEEHVQAGVMTLFHQRLFDWLDETWERKN